IAEANELINIIERLSGEDGSEFERVDLPQILIGDMKNQVESLKKAGDKEKLKAVVGNFSAFVDQLSKKLDQMALKPTDIIFFAQAYNSLEEYAKAAELYARIPEPRSLGMDLGTDKEKIDPEVEREISQYWYLQLQRAK